MIRNPRVWVTLLFALTSALLFAGFVQAHALSGWIGVRVQDDDVDFAIQLPAAMARLALVFVPDRVWREVRTDIGEWGPAVQSAFGELEGCDDAVLVQVESADEIVHVRKSGGRFQISVSTPEEQVDIRVPTRLGRVVWSRIAEAPVSS